jgi:sugar (pentulose or hexulose) kinase
MTSTTSSDPGRKRTTYYPWWLDNLAEDVTGEAAAIQGTLHGLEEVRTLVLDARELYENQAFQFTATTAAMASSRSTRVGSKASPPALSSR